MDEQTSLGWPKWIGVVVDDLESQRRFWADLFGFPQTEADQGYVQFNLGDGRSFELIQRGSDPQYDERRFQVAFAVDDIEHARQDLRGRGIEQISEIPVAEDSPWVYFRDPEQNVFAIKQGSDWAG